MLAPNVLAALSTIFNDRSGRLVVERTHRTFGGTDDSPETQRRPELTVINLKQLDKKREDSSIGRDKGNGRVGFQQNKSGEGSGEIRRKAQGGGGSGDHEPQPPQTGSCHPSNVLAAIPKIVVHSPALPVAGIDVDPALWKDLKAPAYGDPRSTSQSQFGGSGRWWL